VPTPAVAVAIALAATVAVVPARAAEGAAPPAEDATSQGFVLSGRAGLAAPYGDVTGGPGAALDAAVRDKVPLWFEVGYRLGRRLHFSLFFEYARVDVEPDRCLTDDCDGRSVRYGVDLQLQLLPGRRLAPWIGAGVALEFLEVEGGVDVTGDGVPDADGEQSFAGLELPLLEAGLDVVLSPQFRVGPYVAFSPGQFTTVEVDAPGAPGGRRSIDDRATHAWLQGGVKLTFDL
jgi:hypothetical protein